MNAVNLQCQGVGNADTVLFVTCAVLFRRVRPFVFARFFSLSLSPHCCIACAQRNDVSSYDHVTADKMQIILPCYRYERRRNSLYNSTLSLSSLRLDFSCAFSPPFFLSSQQRRMCLVSGDMVRQKHFQTLSDYFCCACAVDFGRFIRCPTAAVDVVLLI